MADAILGREVGSSILQWRIEIDGMSCILKHELPTVFSPCLILSRPYHVLDI